MNSQQKLKGRHLIARKVTTMTNREFLQTIVSANINTEVTDFATEALRKLDERNAKRASSPSKTAVANEPIKQAIVAHFAENHDLWMTASEVGQMNEITTQKASALLRQLVEGGVLKSQETKVTGKGKVKTYAIC